MVPTTKPNKMARRLAPLNPPAIEFASLMPKRVIASVVGVRLKRSPNGETRPPHGDGR